MCHDLDDIPDDFLPKIELKYRTGIYYWEGALSRVGDGSKVIFECQEPSFRETMAALLKVAEEEDS